ncbi:hypothetical protein D9M69_218830 [compost metagenome]
MAALSGGIARSSLNSDNANLSSDLDLFGGEPWPPGASLVSRTPAALPLSALPVSFAPRALAGGLGGAYSADYYHRVHIAPQQLDLGNVVSTQTSTVQLWNAYLEPRTLAAIAGLGEGLEVSGQPAAPMVFGSLQERAWQVSVTPDGQPVLDTVLAWQFENGAEAALRITANRIIGWTFAPDWGDGVLERLTWATDILQSESGVEQRRALRLAPRREFEAPMLVEGRERQLLDLSLFGWSARVWALPIWTDIQLLTQAVAAGASSIACSTTGRDFRAGGLALLRGESAFASETVEVLSVGPTGLTLKRPTQQAWPVGSRLYPARPAQLAEQPRSTRLTDRADRLDARFLIVEPSDWPAALPATLYRGWPVLEERPDEAEDLTRAYQRLLLELDNGSAMPLTTDTAARAFALLQHRWQLGGRTAQAAFRSLLYGLNGRQKALWLPTHASDLTLTAPVGSTATGLSVENVGYTRFGQAKPGRRDLRIELHDGSVFYRRITGATEQSVDVEVLVLDAALGVAVAPAQVARISWLVLCRLDSDSIEIRHETDSDGLALSQAVFRGVRDEEFSA